MRKTLYVDKDTNDILDRLDSRQQSEFVRNAVKYYYHNKDNIEAPKAKLKITKVIT